MLEGDRRRMQHALAREPARQADDALNESDGAHAAGVERRVGPGAKRRPDALAAAEQPLHERLLAGRRVGAALSRRRCVLAGRHDRLHTDERVHLEDAYEVRVPVGAHRLPQQVQGNRIERPIHLDMAVGMDRALAALEVRKRVGGERPQRRLLDLEEMRPHLASRGAVNA